MSAPAFLVVVIATFGSAPRFACVRGGSSGSSDFLTAVITSNGEVETEHDVQTPLLNSSHTLKSGEGCHFGNARSELSSVTKEQADKYLEGVRKWLDLHNFKYSDETFVQDNDVQIEFPVPQPEDVRRLRDIYNLQVEVLVSGISESPEIGKSKVNIGKNHFDKFAPAQVGKTASSITPGVLLRNSNSLKGPFKNFVLASAGKAGEPKVDELVKSAKSLQARLMRIHAPKTSQAFADKLVNANAEDLDFFLEALEFLGQSLPHPESYHGTLHRKSGNPLMTNASWLLGSPKILREYIVFLLHVIGETEPIDLLLQLKRKFEALKKREVDENEWLEIAYFLGTPLWKDLIEKWQEEISSVPDALRAAITVEHPSDLGPVLKRVYHALRVRDWVCIVDNQWLAPRFNGYADIRLNILVFDEERSGVDGQQIYDMCTSKAAAIYAFNQETHFKLEGNPLGEHVSIAELQIHLTCMLEAKEVQHVAYEHGRRSSADVLSSTERASLAIFASALQRTIGASLSI